jgi:hypothetical protein
MQEKRKPIEQKKHFIKLIHVASSNAMVCQKCGHLFFRKCTCGSEEGMKLDRTAYEEILLSITGKSSCMKMAISELAAVLRYFNGQGFRNRPYEIGNEIRTEKNAMIASIRERGREALGDNWEDRITGFMRSRIGIDDLLFCNLDQLRRIQGFISTVARKQEG